MIPKVYFKKQEFVKERDYDYEVRLLVETKDKYLINKEIRKFKGIISNLETYKWEAYSKKDKNNAWLIEEFIENAKDEIHKFKSRIRKLKFTLNPELVERYRTKSFNIEEIKRTPIDDIMPYQPSGFDISRAYYKCPLHSDGKETKASLVVYKDNNTWYCFGCNAHGDIIEMYQQLHECDFITACRALSNF